MGNNMVEEEKTLETELEKRSGDGDSDASEYIESYSIMKRYLADKYYPWIQSACPYYTDHGEKHIQSVINVASSLLGGKISDPIEVRTLDIYLLLCSIIWHDVGMVCGRTKHAVESVNISHKVKEICFPNIDNFRIISAIVNAHSGSDGLKKVGKEADCTNSKHKACTVYPKALAALVRFSDEISETRNRISTAILPLVPDNQKIFWEYANCISAVRPDPRRDRVVVTVSIPKSMAAKEFECKEFVGLDKKVGNITLIEYVVRRFEKMNNERAYCVPHFNKYAWIEEICARFTFYDDRNQLIESLSNEVVFEGNRFPEIETFDNFFSNHPDLNPDRLK